MRGEEHFLEYPAATKKYFKNGAELLKRIDDYFDVHYLDLEWLEQKKKADWHFSLSTRLGDDPEPPNDSIVALMINKLKEKFGKLDSPFAECLWKLIDKKGMTDVETYKKAHLDRRIFSKIRNDKNYMPSKRTILAIAIALECDFKETNTLLDRAGYHLSTTIKEDIVIGYFIENRIYDLFLINEVLDHFGFKTLGD
ncbi:MAG: helix-turn-helix transcriptional regulator [Selenomonadaceae bacterium]|nr:helix-turn-helix transcriptional regulator [Selenomonadaceae bacterium]